MNTATVSEWNAQASPRRRPPRPVTRLAVAAGVLALIGVGSMAMAGMALRDYNHSGPISTSVAVVLVLIGVAPIALSLRAVPSARARSRLLRDHQVVLARRAAAKGRDQAQLAAGYAAGVIILAAILLFVLRDQGAFASTFIALDPITQAFSDVIGAFWTNIWIACIAEVLVLIVGLVVAVMRLLPGRAWFPLRLIATVYCDIFRAIPAIVTIMLVGFGAPLAFKFTADWNTAWLGVIAITLTFSAYVAEVYRAGLTSIHPSQEAAARSLGLSRAQTLRTVLVPQAVRRVIPPLLNDFIGLQKDTALLSVINTAEILLTSKLYESTLFNLSPIALAAAAFVIITIPQARLVDHLIERDARRRGARS